MAQQTLDTTGNEDQATLIARISAMFTELYAGLVGAISAVSLTLSGAMGSATAVVSGLVTAGSLKVDTGTKTAAATSGAATLNKSAGVITSEALTTAAGALYTLTLTDSAIAAADQVMASLQNGTNTQGWGHIESVTPAAGSVVITVRNLHASQALNGTIKIAFVVHKN